MNGKIEPALDRWARNETRTRTQEGDDEKFVMWAKKLLAASREDEAVYRGQIAAGRVGAQLLNTEYQKALEEVKADAKQADAGYSALFHCGDVEELLRLFLTFAQHFRPTRVFKLVFLKGLVERHGGVSVE